jgi:hypothetical protein
MPNQTPFIRGQRRDTNLMNELAQGMLTALELGDEQPSACKPNRC